MADLNLISQTLLWKSVFIISITIVDHLNYVITITIVVCII